MKKIIIPAVALLVAGAGLSAQNLDPTVVVTNTYAREADAVEKPSQLFQMPDSVLRFNYDFDYSALSVPYRGAYEFKPYLVELRPTARPSGEGVLYLSGGAGFTLHPELDVVWTPIRKDNFKLNVYGSHRSYVGAYRNIQNINAWLQPDGTLWSGSRSRTIAGVSGLVGWSGGHLEADIRYRNVFASNEKERQYTAFNALDVSLRVESDRDAPLYYKVFNSENILSTPMGREVHSLTNAGVGFRHGNNYARINLLADIVSADEGTAGNVAVLPRYVFNLGDFHMDIGAKLSFMFRSAAEFYPVRNYPWNWVFPLFPDSRISYNVLPEQLTLYAEVTGGHLMHTYSSLVDENPYLGMFTGYRDASIERWNASLGARGNVSERFYYDARVGYAFRTNALLWGFYEQGIPSFGYAQKYHTVYADATLGWKGDCIDIDSRFLVQKAFLNEERLLSPPVATGYLKAVYDWGERIRAGVTFEGSTQRTSIEGSVPGYVDLGLLGDIQMSRSLGFWLKVNNLLNQSIQRVPFFAERGIFFTVGARLTL